MSKRDKDDRDGLLTLLEEAADHDQDSDEAAAELVADGVDVRAFLGRVQAAIDERKREERLAWRREARENADAFARTATFVDRFALMNRAELKAEARQYVDAVHFKNLEEQTDEDLRTLLQDRARLEALAKK